MLESKKNYYETLAKILLERVKNWIISIEEARQELKKQNNYIII